MTYTSVRTDFSNSLFRRRVLQAERQLLHQALAT
jgi:hypothetical protein